MAYADQARGTTQTGLGARFAALTTQFRAAMARRKLYRDTLREMAALSDRELADLGLHRSEIGRIAWQAAYES